MCIRDRYHGVREGYSGAYQPLAGYFEESLDYGDIYGRLDDILGLKMCIRDRAYGKLELFGPEHCEPNSYESLDYEGRVLVLSPDTLKESCCCLLYTSNRLPL